MKKITPVSLILGIILHAVFILLCFLIYGFSAAPTGYEEAIGIILLMGLCLFLNAFVLIALALRTPNFYIRIGTIVCAVVNFGFLAFVFIFPIIILLSAVYIFWSYAMVYERKSITAGAIISTLCSCLSVLALYNSLFIPVFIPAFFISFLIFYISLAIGKIHTVPDKEEVVLKLEKIDRKTALEFLGVKRETPENITALFNKYEPLLLGKMSPRCVYKGYSLADCPVPLDGDDINEHLENCGGVILFAVTLGLAADELFRNAEASNMSGAVVLDALASAATEQLCDSAETEIKRKYKNVTTRYSPGYGDFPLSIQENLLSALDAKKQIGLYATSDGLLMPRKSVTAVIGIKN
ncbi:MAG: hypothetical protein FWH08_01765 [Oscillospiraceae bacterium]|nr:hypothetical protein [Oscillospiraceae bacterium]